MSELRYFFGALRPSKRLIISFAGSLLRLLRLSGHFRARVFVFCQVKNSHEAISYFAIHQLPSTPETLFLRILGKGKVQRQAVEELEALPKNSPFLSHIIQLVHDLIAVLSARQRQEQDIDKDDQELIMKLSEMYQQQLEEIKKQERQEGVERERRAMIESIMQVRFGQVDSELATIIDFLIAMTREEFTPLLLQSSREELLARFAQ